MSLSSMPCQDDSLAQQTPIVANNRDIKLHESWKSVLKEEFSKPYMLQLRSFLSDEIKAGRLIYPKGELYFNALNTTPIDCVKVVIIGQDPYHGPGQAHGLSFSVPDGVRPPPSLQNIFRELCDDLNLPLPNTGNLTPWAQQGVLLLNSVLTVERGKAASHQGRGWEQFTDRIIEQLAAQERSIVFMLWGSYAIKKAAFVDGKKHLVLKAPHPSPLSAYRGFLGCRHFSMANEFLSSRNETLISWQL